MPVPLRKVVSSTLLAAVHNDTQLVVGSRIDATARARRPSVFLALPVARRSAFGVCGGRVLKQKYAAWKSQKNQGKVEEVDRVVPKWPGDVHAPRPKHAAATTLCRQMPRWRGRGPNAAATDDDTGKK